MRNRCRYCTGYVWRGWVGEISPDPPGSVPEAGPLLTRQENEQKNAGNAAQADDAVQLSAT
jgi:hypothetical protein